MNHARARASQLHHAALHLRKPHGPVGVALTASEASRHGLAYDGETGRSPAAGDEACRDCGYHVCAPNCGDGYPSTAAWHAHKPAAEPAVELAPGWRRTAGCETQCDHVSGASVWRVASGEWAFGSNRSGALGRMATRDEAMARALGWALSNGVNWVKRNGRGFCDCAWQLPSGGWAAVIGGESASNPTVHGEPSLPHAIAWARGDDKLANARAEGERIGREMAAASEAVAAMPVCPKGWRLVPSPAGAFYEPIKPEDNEMLVDRAGSEWNAYRGLFRDAPARFGNFHAACLHALGCRVESDERDWRVTRPGSMSALVWADHELPDLVEALTAERARSAR